MLATIVKDHHDWESYVRATCMAYNTSIHSTTGYSPFFLMLSRRARIPVDVLCGTSLSDIQSVDNYVVQRCRILEKKVRCIMGSKQDRQKELYDRARHGEPFQCGDLVMLHSPVVPRGHSKNLHCPWDGPYKIVKVLSKVTYRIQCCQVQRRRLVVHFDRLKPYPADLWEREPSVLQTAAVPSAPQAQAGMRRPPLQLVEDNDEVISPEESNVSERANEIDSEPSPSFTSEGSGNVNRDLQVLPSTVSASRWLPVSELEIDTAPRAVEINLDQGL